MAIVYDCRCNSHTDSQHVLHMDMTYLVKITTSQLPEP